MKFMHEHYIHTCFGTLITIFGTWGMDVIHTLILAVVGASASFITSLFWRWIKNKFKS